MIKVCCIKSDTKGNLEVGSHYLVDTLDDVDSYVHLPLGICRYIGMYPSTWFITLNL